MLRWGPQEATALQALVLLPAVAGQTLPAADCDEFKQAWAQDTGPTSCLSTDCKRYKVTKTQQGRT